jgi:hypothetical protein
MAERQRVMSPVAYLLVEPPDHLLIALQLGLAVLKLGPQVSVLTPQP